MPGLSIDVLKQGRDLNLCFVGLEGVRVVFELPGCDGQAKPDASIEPPSSSQIAPETSLAPSKGSSASSSMQFPANGDSNKQMHTPASQEDSVKLCSTALLSGRQGPETLLTQSTTALESRPIQAHAIPDKNSSQQPNKPSQVSSAASTPFLNTPEPATSAKSSQICSPSLVGLDAGHPVPRPVPRPTTAVAIAMKATSLSPTSVTSTFTKAASSRPQVPAITGKRPSDAPASARLEKKIKLEGYTVSNVTAPDQRYGMLGYLKDNPVIKAEESATTAAGSTNSGLKTSTVTQTQSVGTDTVSGDRVNRGLQAPPDMAGTVSVAIPKASPDLTIQLELLEKKVGNTMKMLKDLKGPGCFGEEYLTTRRRSWSSFLMAFREVESLKAKQAESKKAQNLLSIQIAGKATEVVAEEKTQSRGEMDDIYVYGYKTIPILGIRTYGKLHIDLKARLLHWKYINESRSERVDLFPSTKVSLTRTSPGILLLELRTCRMGKGTYFSINVFDDHKVHGVTRKSGNPDYRMSHTENNRWVYPGVEEIIKSCRPLSAAKSKIAISSAATGVKPS
ncbi:uncharacterized protein BDZ99DRAFT_549840 [Mytilinidion resinicola]|uniref:Uncharacterized protein n=1 Tax=Mytilinidion resinicola TaxID=574789 RepID=A0A6A6Z3M6_9PEZI|nr:uncharacterized protein BDZ99DRAFT_549840 [Mytilinidion resinicola]KAF2815253.1 hypothetical protein BDZ99DRAFT_549840 [Mytilinidion resinicola]